MAGRTVQEIAAEAVVSVATVRTQVRAVLRKLDVPSQVAAIGRARAAGWIPPQERSRD
jgi:two-component system nitrate/nitrite response regulator NarL